MLLVDDDRNLLDSFRRQFRKRLNLVTAVSGGDALQAIQDDGPFAVVVSDMQMPNMDGVELLTRVRVAAPNTVRIMLTGNANLEVALGAINQGHISRFLNKPVEVPELYEAIIDGIQHYRLVMMEKTLLNKTLKGAVNLLTDILSLVDPDSFSQASRIKRHVDTMLKSLGLQDTWHFELAALLSQIGHITIPREILEKVASNVPLTTKEAALYKTHPEIGSRLLQHIPRLETVAAIVAHQEAEDEMEKIGKHLSQEDKITLGSHLLKVAIAYDKRITAGMDEDQSLTELKDEPTRYAPALVEALAAGEGSNKQVEIMHLPLAKLHSGMILDQNIRTQAGTMLVARGQELSQPILLRLIAAEHNDVIHGPYRVVNVRE
nr:HD domain-containing phosphohydrolase [endosymbiont of Tevnia jerichonana]